MQNLNLTKLKIKAKSLAAEARIIRREERRFKGWKRESLQMHRRGIVRDTARATYLAIAFMKGRPYADLEAKCDPHYRAYKIEPKILAMLQKYYYPQLFAPEQLSDWIAGKNLEKTLDDSRAA